MSDAAHIHTSPSATDQPSPTGSATLVEAASIFIPLTAATTSSLNFIVSLPPIPHQRRPTPVPHELTGNTHSHVGQGLGHGAKLPDDVELLAAVDTLALMPSPDYKPDSTSLTTPPSAHKASKVKAQQLNTKPMPRGRPPREDLQVAGCMQ